MRTTVLLALFLAVLGFCLVRAQLEKLNTTSLKTFSLPSTSIASTFATSSSSIAENLNDDAANFPDAKTNTTENHKGSGIKPSLGFYIGLPFMCVGLFILWLYCFHTINDWPSNLEVKGDLRPQDRWCRGSWSRGGLAWREYHPWWLSPSWSRSELSWLMTSLQTCILQCRLVIIPIWYCHNNLRLYVWNIYGNLLPSLFDQFIWSK